MNEELLNILRTIVAVATPLIIASIGETITERSGIINLSVDGSLVLSAMAGFGVSVLTNTYLAQTLTEGGLDPATIGQISVIGGCIAGILVGSIMALIVAFSSITLRLDQVAVGFVLTLLGADLAEFLGVPVAGQTGPTIPFLPIPILSDIPIIGRVFFQHNIIVYFSYFLVFGSWFWLFRTRPGLEHRAIGERPEAAFARGAKVNQKRFIYALIGGGLVGLAGISYSLSLKPGWNTPPGMLGDGWIALAIVIFGGWHPFRVVLGAYLFAGLRALATAIQGTDIDIPLIVLNGLPWVLMILTLLMVSSGGIERLLQILPKPVQKRLRSFLRSDPPKALGQRFEEST